MIKDEFYQLANGVKIPKVAFGTWQIPNEEAYNATLDALKAGYRHIDTADAYGNEEGVGKAIKDFGIKREDVFITTKLPAEIKSYDEALEHFEGSLKRLGVDYIDLYLIHAPWPWSEQGKDCEKGNIEVWKAFIKLYNEGKVRSIGVSNFQPENIDNLIDATDFVPHVNQIRFFISNTQERITDYCQRRNILIEAYSPLATGKALLEDRIVEMANKYQVTPAQLCLRYCLERNTLPLPKSTHKERIIDNLKLDFKISNEDLDILNHIDEQEYLKKKYRS